MVKAKKGFNLFWTVLLSVASVLYVYPILMILLNSFKKETSISTSTAFLPPTADTFAGAANYVNAISSKGFLQSFWYSTLITVTSVALILLCCSMCAWYITRVNSLMSKAMYYLCVFSMVVPFQMVMFTLSQTADSLGLNKPSNIAIIYLGFGAGLAVFMFCGFVKSIPLEIEEAAMIDGCNPIQTYFHCISHFQAHHDLRRHSGGHVGVERLSAAHAGAGHQKIPHHPHAHPLAVFSLGGIEAQLYF